MKALLGLVVALAGCATTPPCTAGHQVWVEEQVVVTSLPGAKRIGGMMAPRYRVEVIPGHWRTGCVR